MNKQKTVWIDIDNTPHIQYILPVAIAFEKKGFKLCITARDYGQIVDLLNVRGIKAKIIGKKFSRNKFMKIYQTLWRALLLIKYVIKHKPVLSLSNSRATALTSRILAIKNFTFCDYENSELSSYTYLSSFIVHPEVISREVFIKKGFEENKLVTYSGLKENLSLSAFQIPSHCPLPQIDLNKIVILLRPPSYNTHYYHSETGTLFDNLEEFILEKAGKYELELIIMPRDVVQMKRYRKKYKSNDQVILLDKGVEGLNLIWYSDLVFTGGGTMAREAAVLGARAYSVFLSETGAVDKYLESIGKLFFIRDEFDFSKVSFTKASKKSINMEEFRQSPDDLVEVIANKVML